MKNGPDPAVVFRGASRSRCACTSSSLSPGPTPRRGSRASAGIAVSSSPMPRTPIRSSIAARSSAVCGEYGFEFNLVGARGAGGLADVLAIVLRREESFQLAAIRELHLQHPALLIGRLVDELGLLDHIDVALDDLTGHRRVHIRGRFDRFDDAEARELADLFAL